MCGLRPLERDLISQRTKKWLKVLSIEEGIVGKTSKMNDKADIVDLLYREVYKIVDIVKYIRLIRTTVYRALKDLELKKI